MEDLIEGQKNEEKTYSRRHEIAGKSKWMPEFL